jgi:hypothetical protein
MAVCKPLSRCQKIIATCLHFQNFISSKSIFVLLTGMPNIARKAKMGQNLNRMLKVFPKEYAYYPRTWVLPQEMSDFRQQFDSNGNSIGAPL